MRLFLAGSARNPGNIERHQACTFGCTAMVETQALGVAQMAWYWLRALLTLVLFPYNFLFIIILNKFQWQS